MEVRWTVTPSEGKDSDASDSRKTFIILYFILFDLFCRFFQNFFPSSVFSSEDANNIRSQDLMLCIMFLRRKAMTNLDSILKSRDITLSTKVCIVKAMIFLVVIYGCERWTIKKAEH